MPSFSTQGLLLRRTEYGEADLILTFLTPDRGKLSLMAKSARKSRKRFPGSTDLFAHSRLTCRKGRGKLPLLTEAALIRLFEAVCQDYRKFSIACYWAELTAGGTEEGHPVPEIFSLLETVLTHLNPERRPAEELSVLFQMKLAVLSGYAPHLSHCCRCHQDLGLSEDAGTGSVNRFAADPPGGGIICGECAPSEPGSAVRLSRGTVRQLLWIAREPLDRALRIRFSPTSLKESAAFLEAFLPFHLGISPKSLKCLREARTCR